MTKKTNCHECNHSGSNANMNSAHIHCSLFWKAGQRAKSEYPEGEEHGIKSGWYDFPYNYDPTWMKEECPYFSPKTTHNETD
jgi:hypothetical protein